MNEIIIFKSDSFDPWYNLAIEDLLLETVRANQYILYLWRNRDTIVIGKNQNPWQECRVGVLEQDGCNLARRLSGGGAVFHDLGNLNFTFLMNHVNYNLEKQTEIILTAVQKLGIPAKLTGRNDLTVAERKFSGNAFCFRKNSAYHHGTILVASDLEKLTKYLRVPDAKIRSKGIASVRSRVVNLSDYAPSLTVDTLIDKLCYEFIKVYRGIPTGWRATVRSVATLDQMMIRELYAKYASWEWRYGEAPKFDLEMATRFSWGGIEIGLKLEQGIISEAAVYSDAMDEEFIAMLPVRLKGRMLNGSVIAQSIGELDLENARRPMQADILQWIMAKQF
jgi:lipoate-protein ligase A